MEKKYNTCNTLRNIFLMRIWLAVQEDSRLPDWMIAKGLETELDALQIIHVRNLLHFFYEVTRKKPSI